MAPPDEGRGGRGHVRGRAQAAQGGAERPVRNELGGTVVFGQREVKRKHLVGKRQEWEEGWSDAWCSLGECSAGC